METNQETENYAGKRAEIIAREKLTIEAVFVPWSQSRNAGKKTERKFTDTTPVLDMSLNWKIRLKHNGREIITTDYSAGCGHIPDYRFQEKSKAYHDYILSVCEIGKYISIPKNADMFRYLNNSFLKALRIKPPDSESVLYSLIMVSSVLDAGGFDNWSEDLGYDTDSREAEKIYKACLEIALKIRAGLGDKVITELQDAFTDY